MALANGSPQKQLARERSRRWRLRNLELSRKRCREATLKNYWKNRAAIAEKRNSPEWKIKRALQRKSRRQKDLSFRFTELLRNRLYRAVTKTGETRTASFKILLGCSIPELRAHLEKQFRPGMTWENYGPVWHVDHRRPCANFDFSDPEQQKVCFHWTNLQPLFAEENKRKGASYAP